MRVLAAPNALKGSLLASEVAKAMARGVLRADPDTTVDQAPVADGGDGLEDVLGRALHAERFETEVIGPLGAEVMAPWSWLEDEKTAILEMAKTSGLALLAQTERDALRATTYGFGQLIEAALDRGARRILLGIGGSATTDGGAGMAKALGVRFLDARGAELAGTGGAVLRALGCVEVSGLDSRIADTTFEIACDVDNPLLGPRGAAPVFAPQKGASEEDVEALERALTHYADVVEQDLKVSVRDIPGAGAAGGVGFGLVAFLGGKLRPGTNIVFEQIRLEARMGDADLVLTAEGRLDSQTRFGKAPAAVARLAHRLGVPCVAVAGSIGDGIEDLHDMGLSAAFASAHEPMTVDESMARADELIARTTEQVVRLFIAGREAGVR